MTAGRHLLHRCDVQRYATAAQDYGKKRTPAAHLRGVHCRLKTETQRAFNSLTGQWLVSTRYWLQVMRDVDIVAGDRVTAVVDEYGASIPGDFEVAGAADRRAAMLRLKTLELNKVS
jgi:hypothetical protein